MHVFRLFEFWWEVVPPLRGDSRLFPKWQQPPLPPTRRLRPHIAASYGRFAKFHSSWHGEILTRLWATSAPQRFVFPQTTLNNGVCSSLLSFNNCIGWHMVLG